MTINPYRRTFKEMRATLGILQAAVITPCALIDAKTANKETLQVLAKIIKAKEMGDKMVKANPTREKMLVLCAAWYRLGDQLKPHLPEALREGIDKVQAELPWVKDLWHDTSVVGKELVE